MSQDRLIRGLHAVLSQAAVDNVTADVMINALMSQVGYLIALQAPNNDIAEDMISIANHHLDKAVVLAQRELNNAQNRPRRRS